MNDSKIFIFYCVLQYKMQVSPLDICSRPTVPAHSRGDFTMEKPTRESQDEGVGLPHQARRGCLPDTPDALSGRGLFLIHQCFDDVRWSRRGNRVQVACRRAFNDGDSPGPSGHL